MQLRIFIEPQFGASYDDQLRFAQTAEEHGFDAFFRSDHFLTMGGDGLPGPTDSWVTLGAIARETSRIRLGTLLTSATFRLPGLLAIQVAQVDAMSGGRVELGLGTGWFEAEHNAYGVRFPSTGERFARLEEQLQIVHGLWETKPGETFSFDGTHYQLTDSPALPKPVQRPHPPVIVGGFGARRTPRLAVRYADEYNVPFADLATTTDRYATARDECDRAERDLSTLTLSFAQTTVCGATEKEFERRAKAAGLSSKDARRNGIGGTPDEVTERLSSFATAGATRAYLQLLDLSDLDHIALLATEVMPRV